MIYTSYFSSKKYKKEDGVSIARCTKFWKGPTYEKLYPSESLIFWWYRLTKENKQEKEFIDQYISAYYEETLSKLDPHKVAEDLEGKVLLCYEKSGDFCHRRLVANWLCTNGIECKELE